MNKEWSLDFLYHGYDDPKFKADMEAVDGLIKRLNELSDSKEKMPPAQAIHDYLALNENFNELAFGLYAFCNLNMSVNTRDAQAASYMGQLMAKMSATTKATTSFRKYIASTENLDELIAGDELLKSYEYLLNNIVKDNKYLLSEEAEEIMALYDISGGSAWSDLQSSLTSSVTADFRGEKLNLSSIRNKAYDPDPAVRREAYEAELACYDKIKDSVAASLNSIKLQVINESRLRGYASPLDKTLQDARMKRETLDALMEAMHEYMPLFRRYLKIKAKALGHENGLPWYDLFAPMGKCDKTYTTEEARDYLLNIFGNFDKELHDMVERAFNESWSDFYPHEGKVGGAFC